jgi:hypothetical protein
MARTDAVIASLATRLPLPGLDARSAITFARRKTGLKDLGDDVVELDWSRRTINKAVNIVRRCFTWAATEELIPADIAVALRVGICVRCPANVAAVIPVRQGRRAPLSAANSSQSSHSYRYRYDTISNNEAFL